MTYVEFMYKLRFNTIFGVIELRICLPGALTLALLLSNIDLYWGRQNPQ